MLLAIDKEDLKNGTITILQAENEKNKVFSFPGDVYGEGSEYYIEDMKGNWIFIEEKDLAKILLKEMK